MAKCDQGYLCQVCGEEVDDIVESSLYLQYVIGWIDPETLHTRADSHLKCLPVLAQFIDDERFSAELDVPDEFKRQHLAPEFREARTELVTRGYRRLWELRALPDDLPVLEYPLPDVEQLWR